MTISTARPRHLLALIADVHRFAFILKSVDKQIVLSTEGHLAICDLLEEIGRALDAKPTTNRSSACDGHRRPTAPSPASSN